MRCGTATAECYSGSGLLVAARCNEGLLRWNEAEKYYRACSERYEDSSLEWYAFCRRTGQGDLDAARNLAQAYLDKGIELSAQPGPFTSVTFYLLEKQPQKALAAMEQAVAQVPTPPNVLWNAVIADMAKDTKKRDEALRRAKSLGVKLNRDARGGAAEPGTPSAAADGGVSVLADLIMSDLKQGGKGQIDLDAADKAVPRSMPGAEDGFTISSGSISTPTASTATPTAAGCDASVAR